jgi:sporulation integral membrane protein YtvI
MISFYKKYYKTAFDIALVIVTIYLFMFLFSYLYKIAAPIFLSFLIYLAIEPLARWLHGKGMKKSIAAAISTVLFIVIILGSLVALGIVFTVQIQNLAQKIPEYAKVLQEQYERQAGHVEDRLEALPPGALQSALENLKDYSGAIAAKASAIAAGFLSWLFTKLTSFSAFIINFAIGIILAYFLSIEIDAWKRLAREKTPKTFKTVFHFLKDNVLKGIGSYLKAQLKLIGITFAIIFIALLLLGVRNAFSISLLAAIFDLLPLLGVSTLFIPWIIYLLIVGNHSLAIALIVVLAIVIIIRQILEPKITGDSLGVSAFTMLSFMIVSLSLFGVAGLIISPILIITIKELLNQGYLQRWIRLPEEEYEQGG